MRHKETIDYQEERWPLSFSGPVTVILHNEADNREAPCPLIIKRTDGKHPEKDVLAYCHAFVAGSWVVLARGLELDVDSFPVSKVTVWWDVACNSRVSTWWYQQEKMNALEGSIGMHHSDGSVDLDAQRAPVTTLPHEWMHGVISRIWTLDLPSKTFVIDGIAGVGETILWDRLGKTKEPDFWRATLDEFICFKRYIWPDYPYIEDINANYLRYCDGNKWLFRYLWETGGLERFTALSQQLDLESPTGVINALEETYGWPIKDLLDQAFIWLYNYPYLTS